MKIKKKFVLDTSVLVHDPTGWLHAFKDNEIIIPIGVIEELDRIKKDSNPYRKSAVWSAREALRELNKFSEEGNLVQGIETTDGGIIRVYTNNNGWDKLPYCFEHNFDNSFLVTCLELGEEAKDTGDKIILVTKDIALRVKATSLRITAEDYRKDKTAPVDQLCTGRAELSITASALGKINREDQIPDSFEVCGVDSGAIEMLVHNTCCWLHENNSGTHVLAIYDKLNHVFRIVHKHKELRTSVIRPKTEEQILGLALAEDPNLSLVTLAGKTGSGKTMMALLAGYHGLRSGRYEKLVIFRPTEEVGGPMGFLPGTVQEKMAPRLTPIIENLVLIAGSAKKPAGLKDIQNLIEKGQIEISPVNFIRGSTLNHAFVIIDEAQNLTPHVIKTVITRAGEGTVVRLTGDLKQIDGHLVDARSNGFAKVIDVFPGQRFYGHILFVLSVRSELAEITDRKSVV